MGKLAVFLSVEHPHSLGRNNLRSIIGGLLVSMLSPEVLAGSNIAVDTLSYLRTSSEQVNFGSTLIMNPVLKSEGRYFLAEIDAQANVILPALGNVTFESRQAYIETKDALAPGHRFTLGRRMFDWSRADEVWRHGIWVPRFNWNALDPQPVGLTGFFYRYEQPGFRLLAYASALAVPERGMPLSISNGQFVSDSRDNPVLPAGMQFSANSSVPTRYSLNLPPLQQMLIRPSGALQMKFGQGSGAWGSVGYGYMPVHQAEVPISSKLSPDLALDVALHPQFWNHHLLTGETGYRGDRWEFWFSVTREIPDPTTLQPGWFTAALGPTVIGAWGAVMRWRGGLSANASMLGVFEDARPRGSPAPEGLALMDRFFFRRALKFGAQWAPGTPVQYDVNLTHDVLNSSSMLSLDLTVRNLTYLHTGDGLVFGLGADLFVSGTGTGTIGSFEGNDRIRARVTYAF